MADVFEPSTKRPRPDGSGEYLRKLLEPELTKLPDLMELPEFIKSRPAGKFPAMDYAYLMASRYDEATELLIPLCEAPRAQVLAKQVTNVLDGKMRDVSDEGELHVFVDSLFEEMFDLASDHGLLIYQSKRGPTDTTGEGGWPAYLLWVNSALLFKGEEKCHAMELVFAEVELLNKMTSPWDSEVYGDCPYMLAYAVGGNMLSIVAIKSDVKYVLMQANMSTMPGKMNALVAVVNILRLLRAMAKCVPAISWGIGQSYTSQDERDRVVSRVTNMGDYVLKELMHFQDRYRGYTPAGVTPLQFRAAMYEAIKGASHLVQARAGPELRGSTYTVELEPVGVAYRDAQPQSREEAQLAIRCVLMGCGELHAHGYVHRDVRWLNVIKVVDYGVPTIKLIDLEMAGLAGAPCTGRPYPLRYWGADDSDPVLEPDGTYTPRSDLRMVGKELMGELAPDLLGDCGRDLQRRLVGGEFADAGSALAHPWFTAS